MLLPRQQTPLCNPISHCSLLCGTGMFTYYEDQGQCVYVQHPSSIICLHIALVFSHNLTGLVCHIVHTAVWGYCLISPLFFGAP